MDNSQVELLKKMLLDQARERAHTIALMKQNEEADQDVYSPTELSNYDNHPAELGTELFQVELNKALMVHEEHLLFDLNEAIKKIDRGEYGRCDFCGTDINFERLEALPYARLCINCEESKEIKPNKSDRQRPVEEQIWDAPFGRKYLNKQEDDENEGLDQLNDLVKYGSSDTPQDMGGYHDYEEYYTNKTDKQGIVDDMDEVTNDEYKKQLPD
jgi:YteA family regulatory protein